jgi:hypothetical protein
MIDASVRQAIAMMVSNLMVSSRVGEYFMAPSLAGSPPLTEPVL